MFQEPFSALTTPFSMTSLVQPLINRSELLVGKSRTEKLVPGEAEKVRPDPALAGNHYGVAVQIAKARGGGQAVGRQHKKLTIASLGSLVGNTTTPVPKVE